MTRYISNPEYLEFFEYHGSTFISVTRKQGGKVVWRDWLVFDSVEEAESYFYDNC